MKTAAAIVALALILAALIVAHQIRETEPVGRYAIRSGDDSRRIAWVLDTKTGDAWIIRARGNEAPRYFPIPKPK